MGLGTGEDSQGSKSELRSAYPCGEKGEPSRWGWEELSGYIL